MAKFEEQLKQVVRQSELRTLYRLEEELHGKRTNDLGVQMKQWAAKINRALNLIGHEVTISKKDDNIS